MNKPVSQRFLIPKNGKIVTINLYTNNRNFIFNIMVPIKRSWFSQKSYRDVDVSLLQVEIDRIFNAQNYIKNISSYMNR